MPFLGFFGRDSSLDVKWSCSIVCCDAFGRVDGIGALAFACGVKRWERRVWGQIWIEAITV